MVLKLKSIIILFLKGVFIGGGMLVPGVSGGSLAIVFNVYDNLVFCVSNIFKQKLKSIVTLLVVSLGGVLGVLILANPIGFIINNYPIITKYFFLGVIISGIPFIIKRGELSYKISDFLPCFISAFLLMLFSFLPKVPSTNNVIFFIIAGFFGSIALILPGISISFMLLVFGIYNTLINAINSFSLSLLIPFILSMILGIFVFSKLINNMLTKHKKISYISSIS